MRCLECGAEIAARAQVCAWCGAWVNAAEQTPPGPYVPGRGDKIPAGIRRLRRGYAWMAWGAVFGGWALAAVGTYFYDLNNNSSSSDWCVFAGIALWVLAAVLVVLRIRLSWFLRRPGYASGATVVACERGGRMLVLDAPCDGYLFRLKVRLAWWDEPVLLPPGQSVTLYGQPGGVGRVLVSSSAQGSAFVGIGRRSAPSAGAPAVQDAPQQPGGQRAGRRYLVWAPLGIAAVSFVAAVAATAIVSEPSATDGLTADQLMAGDCLTGSNLGLSSSSPWPYTVAVVPCTQRHIAEVFFAGNAWPRSMAYPGDSKVNNQADARCSAEFVKYVGTDNSASAFTFTSVVPRPAGDWVSGDRWLVCVAYESTSQYPAGAPVDYSIKGSRQASPAPTDWASVDQLRSGDCLNGDLGLGSSSPWPYTVAVVPCTQRHIAEVFFAGNAWPRSMAYPGDGKVNNQAQASCNAAFLKYDGLGYADSNYYYEYVPPDDTTWPSGDRFLVCVAYEPSSHGSGAISLNYSIKGSGQ